MMMGLNVMQNIYTVQSAWEFNIPRSYADIIFFSSSLTRASLENWLHLNLMPRNP